MSGKMIAVVPILLVAMLFSVGCQESPTYTLDPDAQPLEGSANVLVPDVPFPQGFNVVHEDTREWGGSRTIYLQLSGNASTAALIDFYKNRKMPLNDWQFQEQVADSGTASLAFRKARERCVITIREGVFDTELRIQVTPVGGAADSGE